MTSLILIYATLIAASCCLGAPLLPSQDPFYTVPHDYQSSKPGTVLRVREAPGNLTSVIGNCSKAYNILYRTTDSRYQPSWAATTLFLPSLRSQGKDISHGALLSYQIPYDTANVDDSPSYALYSGGEPDISNALGQNWFVNVPDYEGPLASFTAGVQSGHATLDSIRAVQSLNFGLRSDLRIALWGYSGGALASEWAAELQVQYAPELEISGMALGGLTPNITSVLYSVNGTLYAGLVPSGLLGLASQYPDFNELLIKGLKPSGPNNRTGFLAATQLSLNEASERYENQNIFDYFIEGTEFFNIPQVKKVLSVDGIMGYHGVPQMPLFVYKAIGDGVSRIEDTDEMVNRYCSYGANILYQRNTIGGHGAESINGDARAFSWLSRVFDGTLQQSTCLTQDVAVNISSLPF